MIKSEGVCQGIEVVFTDQLRDLPKVRREYMGWQYDTADEVINYHMRRRGGDPKRLWHFVSKISGFESWSVEE